jgi:hypothetical protein
MKSWATNMIEMVIFWSCTTGKSTLSLLPPAETQQLFPLSCYRTERGLRQMLQLSSLYNTLLLRDSP